MAQVLYDAHARVPTVAFDFAEEGVALHHAGEAGAVVFQVDEVSVTVFLSEIGQFFGEDVGMHVNFVHGGMAVLAPVQMCAFWAGFPKKKRAATGNFRSGSSGEGLLYKDS
jgi:F0F1-type ATP synthase assembly protein I